MRNWRVLTAIAAVVLAAIAGVLVFAYVDDADQRAERDQELVPVYIAAERVPLGTQGARALDSELITVEERRVKDIPASAIRPGGEASINELVAAADIAPGQFIVQQSFIEPGDIQGTSGLISEGMQAISIGVDETHGVAGFVTPGDTVSVILSFDATDLEQPDAPALKTTAYLLPAVKVLAVGQTTEFGNGQDTDTNGDGVVDANDDQSSEPVQRGLITLEVSPRQAEQIAQAERTGTTYLTLNPPDFDPSTFARPDEIVELTNMFDFPLATLDQVRAVVRNAG